MHVGGQQKQFVSTRLKKKHLSELQGYMFFPCLSGFSVGAQFSLTVQRHAGELIENSLLE